MNIPFICSNISATPACNVYICQFVRYSRVCGSYHDYLDKGFLLIRKLLNFESFTAAILTLLTVTEYFVSHITTNSQVQFPEKVKSSVILLVFGPTREYFRSIIIQHGSNFLLYIEIGLNLVV